MENFILSFKWKKKEEGFYNENKKMVGGLPGMGMDIKCLKRFIKTD